MELHEYPRPANDTGIGIHWCPGYAAALGMAKIREVWIPELRALGVKWVKIYNHDGALDFAELLMLEGFMPIVRLFRPTPNPGRLSLREIIHVDSFVSAGVRYFEFNSEPDRDSEWKGGRVPANGPELVAEDTIVNLESILERGGMPGIPAVSPGSNWDLVGKIVALGRRDLFDGPVWQAVHNYSRNRPLDYPYDIGNQEGAALTERFYRTVADEAWDENAWRGRSLTEVNRLRLDRCAPGSSVQDDAACWLAFERFDALNQHHLGRSLPILGTEAGYLVGDDSDARYPATTPNLHMAQTLEACRVLMGTSTRYPAAPDYLFCATFAVLGNQALGGNSAWWEKYAWYSSRWSGGALPIVRALRAEPKSVRVRQGQTYGEGPLLTLRGAVLNPRDAETVLLEHNGIQIASAKLDPNARYLLTDIPPGAYVLRVEGSDVEQPISLSPDRAEMTVNLDMGTPTDVVRRSVLSGIVDGGAGSTVVLLRHVDGNEYVTMAHDDGGFRFVDLPPGNYSVRVNPDGTGVESVSLDGNNQANVTLAVTGWGYTISTAEETPGIGVIRCRVRGRPGVPVQAHSVAGSSQPVLTGGDPAWASDECLLTGLDNGLYIVTIGDVLDENGRITEPEARVMVDRRRIPLVDFTFHAPGPAEPLQHASIVGRLIGPIDPAAPQRIRLVQPGAAAVETPVLPDGTFRFASLGEGVYSVEVVSLETAVRRDSIALDGANQVAVDLVLPVNGAALAQGVGNANQSVIAGQVEEGANRLARLVDAVGNERRQYVGVNGYVRFEQLPAGEYTLSIDGGYEQDGLRVDGSNGLSVAFAPLSSEWEVQVSRGESMPGHSAVRVEVQGVKDVPVYIWKEDWEGTMKRSGANTEYGPYALEFTPLGPGSYMVEAEGLGVWTGVELTGLEAVWISFRPRHEPSSPNHLAPLPLPSAGRPEAT